MYKGFIKRRIAFFIEKRDTESRKLGRYRVSFFSDVKRKELIVWMRLQESKDKDQVKEFIIDKFNVSDQDAEKLYYEAFPEGLDSYEEEMLDQLDSTLSRVVNIEPAIISNTFDSLMGNMPEMALEHYNIDPSVKSQIKLVVGTILKRRDLI